MSPDNQTLLSNAHDSTVRTWDVRPFAPADRRIQTYDGAPTGQERNLLKASWDSKGEKIAAGSGDQSVAVWETRTGKLLHKLPGHRGAVNDVRFHPLGEPICKYPNSPFTICLCTRSPVLDPALRFSVPAVRRSRRIGFLERANNFEWKRLRRAGQYFSASSFPTKCLRRCLVGNQCNGISSCIHGSHQAFRHLSPLNFDARS